MHIHSKNCTAGAYQITQFTFFILIDIFFTLLSLNCSHRLMNNIHYIAFYCIIRKSFKMYFITLGERAPQPIPPPAETEWYHGRADRGSAEMRLKSTQKLGSYLGNVRL